MTRPIYQIAREIVETWPRVSPYARPYLSAMFNLSDIRDCYLLDSGTEVVARFLANAASYKGEAARRITAEPKSPAEALSEKLWLRWRNQVSPEQAREARQVGEADFYFELAAGEPR